RARDRGDQHYYRVTRGIGCAGDQADSDREKEGAAVLHQMRIERSCLRYAGHELKKPGSRREEHRDPVDDVERTKDPHQSANHSISHRDYSLRSSLENRPEALTADIAIDRYKDPEQRR